MDDIKNLILDKAKDRAERFGFKKTTMDEISKDCRISKKTIYEHFVDKEDMFRCLILRESHKTIQMFFAQMENITDPLQKIILLIKNAVAYFNKDHFITKLLKDDDMVVAFVHRNYQDMIDDEIIAIIAELIRDGKQQGRFRDVDEKITAYIGYRLFKAFSFARTGPLRGEQNEQYYTDALIDFYVHAIVK